MPLAAGISSISAEIASSPPAEAPIPTIGKDGRLDSFAAGSRFVTVTSQKQLEPTVHCRVLGAYCQKLDKNHLRCRKLLPILCYPMIGGSLEAQL
jgi:hypothetical protein